MKYVCIHGHFYQPPRENPWTEAIEKQESAAPYHDWNERINAECYSPNALARVLDEEKHIVHYVNNYAKISFNFGPTLLSWMERNDTAVYQAIQEADAESRLLYSGHGSAMAQGYNHMILPLANKADKQTQVIWGIRDFEHRFKRKPEGMWLPEAAADLASLDALSQHGMSFAVLAPNQASRVRKLGERKWTDVGGGRIDPTVPTLVRLPSGRSIAVFFYDGLISRAVAFEGLLSNGEYFARRLMSAFPPDRGEGSPLVHIATDGETYGHHHRYGEMALAYAIRHIETHKLAALTNYGEYLEKHPPGYVAEIFENSSWSCAHGVERWRSNCGCNSGGNNGWNQEWRGPLRLALDWLRDVLAPFFETKAKELLKKPWDARNDYIDVLLDKSAPSLDRFLAKHSRRTLNETEKLIVWKLMELQRHAMLMYTSCGWFFDELSGIETVQIIQYAGRAVQLAAELGSGQIESRFTERLAKAKSNIAEHGDGAAIYNKWGKPQLAGAKKSSVPYSNWRARAMREGEPLGGPARRSTRIPLVVPIEFDVERQGNRPETFTAWTVMVNKNGAQFDSPYPLQVSDDVRLANKATGKSAEGRVIWATSVPDENGNFEFAIGLHTPMNLWEPEAPPQDWVEGEMPLAIGIGSHSEETDKSSDSRNSAITASTPSSVSATVDTALAGDTLPQPQGAKSVIGFRPTESPGGEQPQGRIDSIAAPLAVTPGSASSEPVVPPAPILVSGEAYRTVPTHSAGADDGREADRLTEALQNLIESTFKRRINVVSEQSIQEIKERFRDAQETVLASLGEEAKSMLTSQSTLLQDRARAMEGRFQSLAESEIQRMDAARAGHAGAVRQQADEIVAAAVEDLRKRTSDGLPALQGQFMESCRTQAESLLSDTLDRIRLDLFLRIEEMGREMERIAERADHTLVESASKIEERSMKVLADATSRMEAQLGEAANSTMAGLAQRIIEEFDEKQRKMLAQVQEVGATTHQGLVEARERVAQSLRAVAETIENKGTRSG